ncbi:MAG TPA: IS1595 family transposase [Terriglobia bacterium]|nr:IS1595 family transposase [Terriglobia bacterium]
METLREAVIYFSSFENCQKFMIESRWPDGKVRCPQCDSQDVTYLKNARLWFCKAKHPRKKFSLKVGTIFEDSPIPLEKWLPACWLLYNCKNGVSSYEIHRDLGVTQKTAWFMLHRLRLAVHCNSFEGKLKNDVEADETYIGGLARNMHAGKRREKITGAGTAGKVAVMGLLQRHGEVRLKVVPNTRKLNLQAEIRENVEVGSEVFTDALLSYYGLDADAEYVHRVIDHAEAYARGNVHTNGLENFWSLLKRGIRGTYVSVEPFHLFRYLDEQAFRFNNRKDMNDGDRFRLAMSKIVGKRLTYKQLTGKTEDDTRQAN